MAINYGNYAQLYGGGVNLDRMAQGIANIPNAINEARTKEWNIYADDKWSEITQPLWDSTLQDVGGSADKLMPGFEFLNAGEAYKKFKGGDFKHMNWAKGKGLLNAPAFMKQYDAYISSYTPMISSKILTHMQTNNLTNKEMSKKIASNPNLRDFLVKYAKDPRILPLLEISQPLSKQYEKAGKEWKEYFESFAAPSSVPGTVLGGVAAYQGLKHLPRLLKSASGLPVVGKFAKGAQQFLTTPSATQTGGTALGTGNMFQTAAAGALAYYTSLGMGKGTETLAELAGTGEKGQRVAKEVGEIGGTTIAAILGRRGLPWVLRTVAKKGGAGMVARAFTKLLTAGVGGAFSGGAVTAAMAAWTMKDIYDIAQILTEADANQQ
tara:strand:- start:2932 stop:4071 length:1140 start_codon:yes stop_codon:yes gene_type:complete